QPTVADLRARDVPPARNLLDGFERAQPALGELVKDKPAPLAARNGRQLFDPEIFGLSLELHPGARPEITPNSPASLWQPQPTAPSHWPTTPAARWRSRTCRVGDLADVAAPDLRRGIPERRDGRDDGHQDERQHHSVLRRRRSRLIAQNRASDDNNMRC